MSLPHFYPIHLPFALAAQVHTAPMHVCLHQDHRNIHGLPSPTQQQAFRLHYGSYTAALCYDTYRYHNQVPCVQQHLLSLRQCPYRSQLQLPCQHQLLILRQWQYQHQSPRRPRHQPLAALQAQGLRALERVQLVLVLAQVLLVVLVQVVVVLVQVEVQQEEVVAALALVVGQAAGVTR